MKMKSVYIIGAKYTSIGDMAITQALEQILLERGYIPTKNFDEAEYLILGPGGILYSREEEQIHDWNNTKVDLRLYDSLKGLGQGKSLLIIGAGSQEFYVKHQMWKDVIESAKFIGVRDYGTTLEMRQSLGLERNDVVVAGDLSFWHYSNTRNFSKPIYPKVLTVSIRTEENTDIIESTHTLLTSLTKEGYSFIWVPHGTSDYINYQKEYIPRYGGILLGEAFGEVFMKEPHKYLAICRCTAGSITHRLHGILLSIITGRPVLSLSEEVKKVQYQIQHLFGTEGYKYCTESTNKEGMLPLFLEMMKDSAIYEQFNAIAQREQTVIMNHFTWME